MAGAVPGKPPNGLRVAVIGAGVIGTSVAFDCLRAGHDVVLVDRAGKDWSAVRSVLRRQQRQTRLVQPSAPAVDLQRLVFSDDLADVVGSWMIVENVTEDLAVKCKLYADLRSLDVSGAYIAANTSAIPIGRLAAEALDDTRVVGVHFMNPVPSIEVVEVVRGPATAPETLDAVDRFLTGLGKRGVVVNDAPGFVINRMLMVMVNQAAQLLDEGIATAHQVDQLFKGCLGHAMGPLRTADLIGVDTVVNTLHVLGTLRGDPIFEPSERLTTMVREGRLGMKTGQGFYDYGIKPRGV